MAQRCDNAVTALHIPPLSTSPQLTFRDHVDETASLRAAGGLYEGRLLDEAVRRYECVWLPFLHRHKKYRSKKVDIPPPLDVAYIWHVHRLDPNYTTFCKEAFGHVFVPKRPFTFSTTAPPEQYDSAWDRTEPFYPPKLDRTHTAAWCELHRPKAPAHLMPRLAEAVKRQASFGHMFLRLCYQDRTYLEQVRLVPTYLSLPQFLCCGPPMSPPGSILSLVVMLGSGGGVL
jgi:hypothetical protein